MSVIYYAVEIITDQTSYTNTTYGIVNGIFRWITGRPGYDGAGPSYPVWEDDTDNTYAWYEDWLIMDQMTNPYNTIDISIAGNYGSSMGFAFNIRNNDKFFDFIRTTPIYLGNRTLKFYVVIDDKFYDYWTGVISNNPFDELGYHFQCGDASKQRHKVIPPNVVDKNNFEDSDDTVQGDTIPIVIGDVSYSKLQRITNEATTEVLGKAYYFPGQYGNSTACPCLLYDTSSSAPILHLYTPNVSFNIHDLDGKYLYVATGGGEPNSDQLILILVNEATSNNITKVYLQEGFSYITRDYFNQYYSFDPTGGASLPIVHTINYSEKYQCEDTEDWADFDVDFIWQIRNGSWIKYDNVDLSNVNASGCNTIDILFNQYEVGKFTEIFVRKDSYDGEILGSILVEYMFDTAWLSIPIKPQFGTIDIVFTFEGNPSIVGTRFYRFKGSHTVSNESTWWFSIVDMNSTYLISESEISQIETDSNNLPLLYTYNKEKDLMEQVSNQIIEITTDGSGDTTHPQIDLLSGNINKNGDLIYNAIIVPTFWSVDIPTETMIQKENLKTKVIQAGHINLTQSKTKSITKTVTRFYPQFDISDRSQLTYIDMDWPDYGQKSNIYSFDIRLEFPQDQLDYDWDTVYCGLDIEVTTSSLQTPVRIIIAYDTIDAFGQVSTAAYKDQSSQRVVYPMNEVPVDYTFKLNCLPPLYYQNGGDTEPGYYSNWYEIGEITESDTTTEVPFKTKLELDSSILSRIKDGTSARIVQMRVFVTSMDADFVGGDVFNLNVKLKQAGFVGVRTISDMYDDYYVKIKGELIGGEETNNVFTTCKLILEQYDGISSSNIDYTNLPDTRKSWHCGRILTEQKLSYDYLLDLAKQSFIGIYTKRDGTLGLKAWREWKPTPATIYPILRDGVNSYTKTEIDKLYNEIEVEYGYNNASNKYLKKISISKIEESSFPPIGDPDWRKYVGGVATNAYQDASRLWTVAQTSYEVSKAKQDLPDNLSKLSWFPDENVFLGLEENLGASTKDSAFKYITNVVEWSTLQKDTVKFYVPLNASFVVMELLDYGEFSDSFFGTKYGWVSGYELDVENKRIQITMVIDPDVDTQVYVDNLIDEYGQLINTDTHDESGSEPDQANDGQGRI